MTLNLVKPTLIFYAVAVAAIFLFEKLSPSGPCTPGLGLMSFFLLIPVSGALLLRNIFLTFSKDREYLKIAFLHVIALVVFLMIMW